MAVKEKSKFDKKIDNICRALFLTEEGKPKSPALLYSFCLSLGLIVVYFIAYFLLVDVIENVLSGCTAGLRNAAEIIMPGLIASIPLSLSSYLFNDRKQLVFDAYVWFAILLVMTALLMIFYCDWSQGIQEYLFFCEILGFPWLSSLLIGGSMSYMIYKNR